MRRARRAVMVVAIASASWSASIALLTPGCAPRLATPPEDGAQPSPAPAPASARKGERPKPGYTSRVDDLRDVDPAALASRRIAIDPGHGGRFPGSIGLNGLTEAEVNLGVALHLRGLLEGAGAQVFMTRTDDRDFLSPADSSLRADLAGRTRLANAWGADLFISIHHNADAGGAHDVNEIQTYYKLGDDGASLDAAQRVHRYLVRNLGIEAHRIVPGNYFVLRNSNAPALLTESSYLTNPDVEAKLALGAKQRLEAEALYLGIGKFFGRGAPVVEEFRARAEGYPGVDSAFISPTLTLVARIRGAFDDAVLTVDGVRVAPRVYEGGLEWQPAAPLTVGMHEASLRVALAGEGSSVQRSFRFHIASWKEKILAKFPEQFYWDGVQPLGLRVQILDTDGNVYMDTVRVRIRDVGTRPLVPADTQIVVNDGSGWAYFRASTRTIKKASHRLAQVKVSVGLWPPAKGEFGIDITPDVTAGIASGDIMPAPVRTAMAVRMPGEEPLRDAPGTTGPNPSVAWINRDGFVHLWRDSSGAVRVPELRGYRPWPSDSVMPPRLVAIAGGALHGRRVVIDPDGGGDAPGGVGPSGTRGAHVNLEVARALAGFLATAGAEVSLTRSGDFALSDVERVEISEAFHAERFLRIGHRAEPPRLGHYFASAAGRRWAERAREALARAGLAPPAIAEDAQYPLQQTSCPALYAAPARIDVAAEEEKLAAPGTVRAEAYALYLSLAREWSEGVWPADSLEVHDPAGAPLPGALVTLGRAFVLETDASGRVRFTRTEPGPIEVFVAHSRGTARVVLLDSQRGVRIIANAP